MSRGSARRGKRNRWIARSQRASRPRLLADGDTLSGPVLSGCGSLSAVRMFRTFIPPSTPAATAPAPENAPVPAEPSAETRVCAAMEDHHVDDDDPTDLAWALISWPHSTGSEFSWHATRAEALIESEKHDRAGTPWTIIDRRIAGTRSHRPLLTDNDVRRIRRLPADSTLCSVRRDRGPTRFQ